MMSPGTDLERFRHAQDQPHQGYADALRELQSGAKRGHWIWYILPQLSGLGSSEMARTYGVRGVVEAGAYLRDPVLRERLLAIAETIAAQVVGADPTPLPLLMGSDIDVRKLVSSLTLFEYTARAIDAGPDADEVRAVGDVMTRVLDAAAAQGYERCAVTRRLLPAR